MFGTRNIPSVGEVQLCWVPNPPISIPSSHHQTAPTTTTGSGLDAKAGSDEDTIMDSAPADQTGGLRGKEGSGNMNADVDYDVAEVDDSWGVE
ncbi:hypothetical protein BJX76DRAFT_324491 [Aspergillus varians]